MMRQSIVLIAILFLVVSGIAQAIPAEPAGEQEQRSAKDEEIPKDQKVASEEGRKKEPARFSSFEALNRFLSQKAEANQFSGAVMIAGEGKPVFRGAYGFASKRFDVANTIDTKFNLGSINKIFTAVAILQLAEKGKLTLDDPIGKYLSGFPADIARKVTIHNLLAMDSGWGDYWENEDFKARQFGFRRVSDYLAFIKDIPLDFEPGTDTQHSNAGFEVAGAIIEKVSGEDYYDYIRTHIYEPLGMSDTDSFHRDSPVKNLATGYTNHPPEGNTGTGYEWSNTYIFGPRGSPAGGGYSTVEDMMKFARALRNNKILTGDSAAVIWNGMRGYPGDPIYPEIIGGMWTAEGGAQGISTIVGIYFKYNLTFVVLSNYDFPIARDLLGEIIGRLDFVKTGLVVVDDQRK